MFWPHNISALGFFLLLALAAVLFSNYEYKSGERLLGIYGFWTAIVAFFLLAVNYTSIGPAMQKIAVGHSLIWMAWFALVEKEKHKKWGKTGE